METCNTVIVKELCHFVVFSKIETEIKCIYMYFFTHTSIYMYVYMYVCCVYVCIYIYVWLCMYMYVYRSLLKQSKT